MGVPIEEETGGDMSSEREDQRRKERAGARLICWVHQRRGWPDEGREEAAGVVVGGSGGMHWLGGGGNQGRWSGPLVGSGRRGNQGGFGLGRIPRGEMSVAAAAGQKS